jgi:hypothetical protein
MWKNTNPPPQGFAQFYGVQQNTSRRRVRVPKLARQPRPQQNLHLPLAEPLNPANVIVSIVGGPRNEVIHSLPNVQWNVIAEYEVVQAPIVPLIVPPAEVVNAQAEALVAPDEVALENNAPVVIEQPEVQHNEIAEVFPAHEVEEAVEIVEQPIPEIETRMPTLIESLDVDVLDRDGVLCTCHKEFAPMRYMAIGVLLILVCCAYGITYLINPQMIILYYLVLCLCEYVWRFCLAHYLITTLWLSLVVFALSYRAHTLILCPSCSYKKYAAKRNVDPELFGHLCLVLLGRNRTQDAYQEAKHRADTWLHQNKPDWSTQTRYIIIRATIESVLRYTKSETRSLTALSSLTRHFAEHWQTVGAFFNPK